MRQKFYLPACLLSLVLAVSMFCTSAFASNNFLFGSDYNVKLSYFVTQTDDFEDLYYSELTVVGTSDVIQYVNKYDFTLRNLGSSMYFYNYVGTQFKFSFNRYFNYGESRVISFTIKPSFDIRSIYVTETVEDTTMDIGYTEHLLYSETCAIGAGDIYNFSYNYNMRYNGPNRVVNVYFISDVSEQIKGGTWYLNDINVSYYGEDEELDSSGGILAFIKNIFARLGNIINAIRAIPEAISSIVSNATNTVTTFFTNLFDDLKEWILSLFVPSDGYFDVVKQRFIDVLEEHYQPIYYIIEFVEGLFDLLSHPTPQTNITFPQVSFQGYTILPRTSVTIMPNISTLQTTVRFATSFVLIVALFNYLKVQIFVIVSMIFDIRQASEEVTSQ